MKRLHFRQHIYTNHMNIGIMEQQDFDNITNRLFNKINVYQKTAMLGKIDYYKNLYKIKPSGDIELWKQFMI